MEVSFSDVSTHIIKILDKTGSSYSLTSESLRWMNGILQLNDFFEWLTNCITEDNFVTNDEILCYNNLVRMNKLLPKDKLDSRLNNCVNKEPSLYSDELSVEVLQKEIEFKEKELKRLNFLKDNLSGELRQMESEKYRSTSEKLLDMEVEKVNNFQREYMKQFNILEQKYKSLGENISTIYSNGKEERVYLCQADLAKYVATDSNLEHNIELIKKKLFEEKNNLGSNVQLDTQIFLSYDHLLDRLFRCISLEEYRAGIFKIKEIAATKQLEHFTNLEKHNMNLALFLSHENENSGNMSNCMELPGEDDLIICAEFYAKDIIRGIQLDICEKRLNERKNKLTLLDSLENVLKIRRLCNESLHFLFMNQWKLIRESLSLLKSINSYWKSNISEFNRRMSLMSWLIIKQQKQLATSAANSSKFIKNTASNDSSILKQVSYRDSQRPYLEQLKELLENHKDCIQIEFQEYCTNIRNIIAEVEKIDKYIFCGPTRTVTFNFNILQFMKDIGKLCKLISSRDIEQMYDKYQEPLNEYENLLHTMWYEWKKNPFEVTQKILKMEEVAKSYNRRHSILVKEKLSTAEFKEEFSHF